MSGYVMKSKQGIYARFLKRPLDLICSLAALIVLSPVLVILSIIGAIAMQGNPFFVQRRPGRIDARTGIERIFPLIKFRTMSNRKDAAGNLLPDEQRLNAYGRWLRSTSLDELPSLICIVMGWLAIVGPRPQLVRDMVFMTEEQRHRHDVRPGLTGLAQVNGRNNITWERKFEYDLQYVENITFLGDVKIIFQTIGKVLKRSDTVREGTASDLDFGDWLLQKGSVSETVYTENQEKAEKILVRQ